jgi:hypothetical protein
LSVIHLLFFGEFERQAQYSVFGNFDINQVPLRLTVEQTFIPSESKDFDRMTYRKRELQNGKQEGCLLANFTLENGEFFF